MMAGSGLRGSESLVITEPHRVDMVFSGAGGTV